MAITHTAFICRAFFHLAQFTVQRIVRDVWKIIAVARLDLFSIVLVLNMQRYYYVSLTHEA